MYTAPSDGIFSTTSSTTESSFTFIANNATEGNLLTNINSRNLTGGTVTINGGSGAALWIRNDTLNTHVYVKDTDGGVQQVGVPWDGNTSWHGPLVRWVVSKITGRGDPKEGVEQNVPVWGCSPDIPVVTPVLPATLADLMALVEQAGYDVDVFVTSCRDFADVRKWDSTEKVRWEGNRVWVFGVEVLRSKDLPAGCFCAVSRSEKMAVAEICR